MGKGSGDSECNSKMALGVVLELPRHGSVEITPGVIDDAARFAFTAGHCHALALAIHEHTGWPMLAMSSKHSMRDILQHVVVVMPDGRWLDINGPQNPEHRWLFKRMSADEVANMSQLEYWDDPQTEVARDFVQPLLDCHQIKV